MRLYVLRHAQSVGNVKQVVDEDPKDNYPLTPEGERQAAAVANELKDIPLDAIYTSQFNRTRQTATIVNRHHGLTLIADERINESRSGFNRQPFSAYLDSINKEEDRWNARFNDGESFEDEKRRVHAFLEDLAGKPYRNVLIVTHADPFIVIHGRINGLSNEEMKATPYPKNATYQTYDLQR